jgi:hypothetical protein
MKTTNFSSIEDFDTVLEAKDSFLPETQTADNLLHAWISVCRIGRGKIAPVRQITVSDALEKIRCGCYEREIKNIRSLNHLSLDAEAKKEKTKLPAFTFSGRVEGNLASAMNEGRFQHSGLLQLDFDDVAEPAKLRDELFKDCHVLASWISPSGTGVKALAAMQRANSEPEHKQGFANALSYFAKRDWHLDPACKNSNRLCYASFDRELQLKTGEIAVFSIGDENSKTFFLTPLSVSSTKSMDSMDCLTLTMRKPTLADKIRASEFALMRLKEEKRIYALFKKYIANRFNPTQGQRNTHMIQMVTFLYRAVGAETLLTLVGAYYDLNQEIFLDTKEQHMAEAKAHLDACHGSWVEELPSDQKAILELPFHYQEAFRICRDLATHENVQYGPQHFFMSHVKLAERIGIEQHVARRILQTFVGQEWISVAIKGTQHAPNSPGKATTYRWLLPVTVVIFILSAHRIFQNDFLRAFPTLPRFVTKTMEIEYSNTRFPSCSRGQQTAPI